MKLEHSRNRIIELMARFVAQIEGATSMGKTDLNKTAETILIPLLNEVYGWSLENINYAEDNNNYPGIDLADEAAKISIQVTATPDLKKVKHTLEQFTKHNRYLKYDRLIIYVLRKKQDSYSETTIQGLIQNKFSFDSQKDIWDHRDILKEVSNFPIDRALKVQEILEAYFGEDQTLTSLLANRLEQTIDWRETSRELLNHWKGLTTNVLTKPNGVRFQLDEIFVPLGVLERREKPKHRSNDGFPAEQGSELYEEKVTPISQNEFFEQVLRQRQSKHSQGSRIAIIGEPGAGKTTQLQKIAHWILEETDGFPIWIPLTAVGTKKLKDYLLSDWLQTAIDELDVSQGHRDELGQLLKTGKVWLLLDGVDEMATPDALYQIDTQMREGWLRNVRVVLTCRLNVWDAGKNALDGFDVYRNLDFDYPSEVHQFLGQWFATEPDLQQTLNVALEQPGKERIRDMVKNPLRLTLLCYSWQLRQGELPETKAGLYEWFVDTFYVWNKGKVPTKLSVAKREELNRALGELAKEAIDQETSRFRLREKFISRFLGNADDEDSLFYLALQLGWLNRIGVAAENPLENVYAFFHPTFQEYFAALAIDDWHYFLNHVPYSPDKGSYRIFNQYWKETFLLWLGQASTQSKDRKAAIDSLVNFADSCESFYEGFYHYQAYFLAASALGELCGSSMLASRIINQVIELFFGYIDFDRQKWTAFPEFITDEAKLALQETDHKEAIKIMADLLGSIRRNKSSGTTLSEDLVITKLIKLVISTDIKSGIFQLSKFLLEFDSSNQEAIDSLADLLNCQHLVREAAASILQKADPNNLKAENIQNKISEKVKEVTGSISQALEIINLRISESYQSIGVMSTLSLIQKLHESYENEDLLLIPTIERLGEIGFGDIKAIAVLVFYLFKGEDPFVCEKIYLSLKKIITSEFFPPIIEILKRYLISSKRTVSFPAFEYGLNLLWYCTRNMSYPEFCRAWHNSSSATAELLIDDGEVQS